jgi:hypothetical protein
MCQYCAYMPAPYAGHSWYVCPSDTTNTFRVILASLPRLAMQVFLPVAGHHSEQLFFHCRTWKATERAICPTGYVARFLTLSKHLRATNMLNAITTCLTQQRYVLPCIQLFLGMPQCVLKIVATLPHAQHACRWWNILCSDRSVCGPLIRRMYGSFVCFTFYCRTMSWDSS